MWTVNLSYEQDIIRRRLSTSSTLLGPGTLLSSLSMATGGSDPMGPRKRGRSTGDNSSYYITVPKILNVQINYR